jgi:hypothetical protein
MTCDCLASSGDGCDAATFGKELFPGVGCGIKDGMRSWAAEDEYVATIVASVDASRVPLI